MVVRKDLVIEQLQKLISDMKFKGIVTDDEYDDLLDRILDDAELFMGDGDASRDQLKWYFEKYEN